ncbi:YpmS family protein [Virgibacillus kimchii]
MPNRADKRMNKYKWKRSFFILLGFNILVLLIVIGLIFWPVSETDYSTFQTDITEESSEFVVRTTKENLNELVNAYIDQLLIGSDHRYRVELDEDVHLIGELPVFSSTVPLSVHFEPIVQDNGDLVLQQRSISVGLLELPNQRIMDYMERYLPMPEWVSINPAEEEIYVAVTDMDIRSNFVVGVENIDLEGNNLAFKINVPYRTLGIDLNGFETGQ